jgi:hypothetical protein
MPRRFTIRDLFWLVLVVALAVGWWVDHYHNPITNHPLFKILPQAAQQKVLDNLLGELKSSPNDKQYTP